MYNYFVHGKPINNLTGFFINYMNASSGPTGGAQGSAGSNVGNQVLGPAGGHGHSGNPAGGPPAQMDGIPNRQAQVVAQPLGQTQSFSIINGVYTIHDPTNVGGRGYLDPNTGQPYPTSQPYARHLADAMDRNMRLSDLSTGRLDREFDICAHNFFYQFQSYNFPHRHQGQWYNSSVSRKQLKNLP